MTKTELPDFSDSTLALGKGYWTKNVGKAWEPVGQFRLAHLIDFDPRASRRHRIMWMFHLGWSHDKYGHTSLASVRRTEAILAARSPTGRSPISISDISAANADLVEWGYMAELEKGRGRRGSRFLINWNLLEQTAATGGGTATTSDGVKEGVEDPRSVPPVPNTSVPPVPNATRRSVPPVPNEDSTTVLGQQDPSTCGGEAGSVAGAAHHPDRAPDGAGAGVATGFERFWDSYGHRFEFEKAEGAWRGIKPSAELAGRIIEAATAWHAEYRRRGTEARYIIQAHNWLLHRRWNEAGPPLRRDRGGKAASASKPAATQLVAANDNLPAVQKPAGWRPVTMISAELVSGEGIRELVMRLATPTGEVDQRIVISSNDIRQQAHGQSLVGGISLALGKPDVNLTDLPGLKAEALFGVDGVVTAYRPR